MFRIGDYVVRRGYGICRIEAIGHPSVRKDVEREYYTLRPIDDSGLLHVPVDASEDMLRAVISKDEAIALIDGIPSMKISKGTNDRLRTARYKEAIDSGSLKELLNMIKEIYEKNKSTILKGKGIASVNEGKLFTEAEGMFTSEIALALGCKASDVPAYISEHIKTR